MLHYLKLDFSNWWR